MNVITLSPNLQLLLICSQRQILPLLLRVTEFVPPYRRKCEIETELG